MWVLIHLYFSSFFFWVSTHIFLQIKVWQLPLALPCQWKREATKAMLILMLNMALQTVYRWNIGLLFSSTLFILFQGLHKSIMIFNTALIRMCVNWYLNAENCSDRSRDLEACDMATVFYLTSTECKHPIAEVLMLQTAPQQETQNHKL